MFDGRVCFGNQLQGTDRYSAQALNALKIL